MYRQPLPLPDVGEIVHYVSHGTPVREDGSQAYPSVCRAAIVTEVTADPRDSDEEQMVGLAVQNPTGQFFHPLAAGGCGRGMHVELVRPEAPDEQDYLVLRTVDGTWVPWVVSQTDALATDWEVV